MYHLDKFYFHYFKGGTHWKNPKPPEICQNCPMPGPRWYGPWIIKIYATASLGGIGTQIKSQGPILSEKMLHVVCFNQKEFYSPIATHFFLNFISTLGWQQSGGYLLFTVTYIELKFCIVSEIFKPTNLQTRVTYIETLASWKLKKYLVRKKRYIKIPMFLRK